MASSTGDPNALDAYLSSIAITPRVFANGAYSAAELYSDFTFTLPKGTINWGTPVQIDVDLKVKTGEAFESGKMYANYKVLLTVELLHDDGSTLDGSRAYDYIIYTNTKIRKELIS